VAALVTGAAAAAVPAVRLLVVLAARLLAFLSGAIPEKQVVVVALKSEAEVAVGCLALVLVR
jgi:hypothetical protein